MFFYSSYTLRVTHIVIYFQEILTGKHFPGGVFRAVIANRWAEIGSGRTGMRYSTLNWSARNITTFLSHWIDSVQNLTQFFVSIFQSGFLVDKYIFICHCIVDFKNFIDHCLLPLTVRNWKLGFIPWKVLTEPNDRSTIIGTSDHVIRNEETAVLLDETFIGF